jgi:hypothetical protein
LSNEEICSTTALGFPVTVLCDNSGANQGENSRLATIAGEGRRNKKMG